MSKSNDDDKKKPIITPLANMISNKNRSIWSEPQHWRDICPELTITGTDDDDDDGEKRAAAVVSAVANAPPTSGSCTDGDSSRQNRQRQSQRQRQLQRQRQQRMRERLVEDGYALSDDFSSRDAVVGDGADGEDDGGGCGGGGGGQAKYVTLWLALTDATPENSCLYVIPRRYDPGYMDGDDDDENDDADDNETKDGEGVGAVPDPMRRALTTKESYQNIRALPRLAGPAV